MIATWDEQALFGLKYCTQAADAFFQKELERVYGKNACNARYYPAHEDLGVLAARAEFHRTGRLWRGEQENNR